MAHIAFLRRNVSGPHDCFCGSPKVYHRPSHRRFFAVFHNDSAARPAILNNSNESDSKQKMGRPRYIRKIPSEGHDVMEQLHDLWSSSTTKSLNNELDALKPTVMKSAKGIALQATSMPKEPPTNLTYIQKKNLPRFGAEPRLTAKEVSQNLFKRGVGAYIRPIYLRDACNCPQCVDPSTRQRNYSFVDIPTSIKPVLEAIDGNHVYHVSWENDVPGFDKSHISLFPASRIEQLLRSRDDGERYPRASKLASRQLWDAAAFTERGRWIEYKEYMNDASSLRSAISALRRDGLLFVRNVPPEASSVGKVAERIGPLRNTFYGATWDVRSVADAKNVAYTSKHLGFHMDLLYMDSPPDFQLLHCIHNSCAGGESRFVDTYQAARIMHEETPDMASALRQNKIRYTYDNDGHYYTNSHRIFNTEIARPIWLTADVKTPGLRKDLGNINWSPEFMDVPGIDGRSDEKTQQLLTAAKTFAQIMERKDLVYQVKMDEGTCVIFENRRVAHARNAFQMQSGERWLRGAYLDYDVFWSKYKVLGLADYQSEEDINVREVTEAK